jgi:hypothetical protein
MDLDYFLIFSMHFDRDQGLDQGRLSINSLSQGTKQVFVATSSQANSQQPESFHKKGGLIPPQYRCGIPFWKVNLIPIAMNAVRGVEGAFYVISPHMVTTDAGGVRGDFGIHRDANVPGSLGCIVLSGDRFSAFEAAIRKLVDQGIKEVPLFVQYS